MTPQRPVKPAMRRLVDFYDPIAQGKDAGGRTLAQILHWPDAQLEAVHDYIQILFPLPEGSIYNEWAPVFDEETYLYLRQDDVFKHNMCHALDRMLDFYGFDINWGTDDSGRPTVLVTVNPGAEDFDTYPNFRNWVVPMNHNHLRITRILRCLRVLGLKAEAQAFFAALDWVFNTSRRIGNSSMEFWKRAVYLPLHIAPDGTEVDWLKKYEEKEEKKDGGEVVQN